MGKRRRTFESEVHLGLLAIICFLLILIFTANLVIYRAHQSVQSGVIGSLNSAALAVSRSLLKTEGSGLVDSVRQMFMHRYDLSGLTLIPSELDIGSPESRQQWLSSVVRDLPLAEVPEIAQKVLAAEFQTLTRGSGNEYYFVYPVVSGGHRALLILSKESRQLAYLDDSRQTLLLFGIIAVLAIVTIYITLSRFILAPFRQLKQRAREAGRVFDSGTDEVAATVEEYQKIIGELKDKEATLRRLNELISLKADSLEQFNRYLLSSMSSGILTVDWEGRIRTLNRAAAEMLGVPVTNCQDRPYQSLLEPTSEPALALQRALATKKNVNYREIQYGSPDGTEKHLGLSASVIADHENQPIGVSLLVHDLTELSRLRRELETKNRLAALGEMAGGLAHQLRNSIAAIAGYCNLLNKKLSQAGMDTSSIAALQEETAQTEQLIDRFLQFARPLDYTPQDTPLREVVAQVATTFEARAQESQVRVVVRQYSDVVVRADPLLLKQALTNIVENAVIAYEDRQGLVEIQLSVHTDEAQIEIQDTAGGIATGDVAKIFTPFYSSRPSGTGLGLPLARKIIDLHGGSITVHSEPGLGTTFVISLPASKPFDRRKSPVEARAQT